MECIVFIWSTDKQLSDALMVLGKRIVQKHVSAPRKKKQGMATSGLVTAAPGPLSRAVPL